MNTNEERNMQGAFADACEGETNATSVHTPQTIDSGEQESAPAAGEQTTTREESFRALMEGEYKDLFTAYFQETFNRRFKEHKSIKAELESSRAVIAAAEERFGVTDSEALLAAIRAETEKENAPTACGEAPSCAPSVPSLDPEALRSSVCRELLDSIRARGLRPAEGALGHAALSHTGGIQLNRTEREELAKRAARGEQIVL